MTKIIIEKLLPMNTGAVVKEPEYLDGYVHEDEAPLFYRMSYTGDWECLDGAGTLTAKGVAELIYRNAWEVATMTEFEALIEEHHDWWPTANPHWENFVKARNEEENK